MHSNYESTDLGFINDASRGLHPDVPLNQNPPAPPEKKTISRTAWKGEYEKANERYLNMKSIASFIAIFAGLEAVCIVILLLK
jgi:hypothetical protein